MLTKNVKGDKQQRQKSQNIQIPQSKAQENVLEKQRNTTLKYLEQQNQLGENVQIQNLEPNQQNDQIYTQINVQSQIKQIVKDTQRKESRVVDKQNLNLPNGPDDQFNTFSKQKFRESVQSNGTYRSELNDQVNIDYNLNKNIIKARQSIFRAQQAFQPSESKNQGELVIENERLKTTILVLNQKLKDQEDWEDQIKKQKAKIFQFEQQQNDDQSEILSLKSQLTIALKNVEIYKQRYDDLNQEHEQVHEQKINIKYDNEDLNSKIVSLEEDLYESKTIQLDLLEQLKLLESQLHQAETKIQELLEQNEQLAKMQAIYIGHRKDKVDIVLGNFINTFPEREKMKILFLRESEGVYQFGQKRVYIKIGKGNQLVVRVGGGYMLIQDFIEQYTNQEVERIQRKDIISRFQNKLSLQNITTKADFSYEFSPVRSPHRKDQILQKSPTSKSPIRSKSGQKIKRLESPQQKQSLNSSPRKI